MARVLSILALLIAVLHLSQGRRSCWYCKNARTNAECLRKGRLQLCLINQEFCQNEIRAIGGGRHFEVTKRCKQDNSCTNNKVQNFTGIEPFQCATQEPHSVCRCCCGGFDNCNGPEVACLQKPPSCSRPDAPINGYVICPSFLLVGASCRYRCRYGFQLEGDESTQCQIIGTEARWTNGPPTCKVVPCRALVTPEAGTMTCTDEWNIGSECTFECDPGRVLIGKQILKCSIFSIWDDKEPECKIVTCLPPRPLDPNFVPRQGECTDGYNYLSTCTFTCHPDYDRIGDEDIVCGLPVGSGTRGRWDKKPPQCRIKTCEPRHCVTNSVGETCTFECERCQRLEGESEIQCTRDGWTGEPPTCPVVVCGLPPSAPDNGAIECNSEDNKCDDSCRYSCDSGYRLVGPSRTVCLQSGRWSEDAPICELSECDPIVRPGITVTCTNGRIVGSECRLTCNEANQEFIGESDLVCKKDPTDPRPVWDKELNQYCRHILCNPFPRPGESPDPDAGSLTCGAPRLEVTNDRDGRSGWRVGAQCQIQCNRNYQEKDLVSESICTDVGSWTERTLCCVECLPNPLLDVVVLLDRTEGAVWDDRLSFLGRFLDFLTFDQSFNLNITFIPFAEDVDYANAVDFMAIDDDRNTIEDLDFLQEEFEGIPGAARQNSNSGKALKEAVDNIFGFHNYRVPMIFLLTNKAPSDLALARRTVQELQRKKIYLRIFPIDGPLSANAGARRAVLRSLTEADDLDGVVEGTEDEDNETDFYLAAGEGLITVTQRVCNEKAQGLQPCLFA